MAAMWLVACHRTTIPNLEPAPIPLGVTGTVRFHGRFASRFVPARNVEVWVPPTYFANPNAHYPVIYVHDGQNVFAPATSFVGVDWGVDETMTRLIAEHRVRPAIIVAIWNTANRVAEYLPRRPLPRDRDLPAGITGAASIKGPIMSDDYLLFIVKELKPFVDSVYRTRTGRADTFLMGSSMGGLISLYGVTEYPDVFGGAACLSTHWPAAEAAMVSFVARALPAPGAHRFYFDHGTEALDSLYSPLQRSVNESMRRAGYTAGRDWITRVFPGADHSERSWRTRVAEPLVFLLGTNRL